MNIDQIPECIERTETPRGDIQLQRRGSHFEVISNGTFLMATYNGKSERLLVRTALDRLVNNEPTPQDTDTGEIRVLIGGLGVGYSLVEAVHHPHVDQVTVVEIEPRIIEWNRTYLSPFNEGTVDHPSVEIVCDDLVEWIQKEADCGEQNTFDVIALDIDNGPDWTVTPRNQPLYESDHLDTLSRLMNPGGILSVWSAAPSPTFVDRLHRHFNMVEQIEVQSDRGEPDFIFLATN